MVQVQEILSRYGDWVEKHPNQALAAHVGVYLLVSAGVIALGLTIA